MRAIHVLVVLALIAAPAHAQGVGVVVTGDGTIQPQLAAQIEDWLRERGHALVAAPLRPDALGTLIDCFVIEDVACARKVVEAQASAGQLLFAKADLSTSTGNARDITITAYWFAPGKEPMAARRTCSACPDASMHQTIDDLMTTLAGTARADVARLALTVQPASARVRIDGKDAAAATELPIGTHEIVVSAPGYEAETRTVVVKGGEQLAWTIALRRDGGRSKLVVGAFAGGAALLVGGIVLYATSETDTGEKPEYRDTRAGGIALSLLGVAALGAGTWLYFREGGARDRVPDVAILPGGAYVGWSGSF